MKYCWGRSEKRKMFRGLDSIIELSVLYLVFIISVSYLYRCNHCHVVSRNIIVCHIIIVVVTFVVSIIQVVVVTGRVLSLSHHHHYITIDLLLQSSAPTASSALTYYTSTRWQLSFPMIVTFTPVHPITDVVPPKLNIYICMIACVRPHSDQGSSPQPFCGCFSAQSQSQ